MSYGNEDAIAGNGCLKRTGLIRSVHRTGSRDGRGETFGDGARVLNWTEENKGNISLFAQWSPNTYRLHYGANGEESARQERMWCMIL